MSFSPSSIPWAITISQNPITPVKPATVSVGIPGILSPLYGFTASLKIYDALGNLVFQEQPLTFTESGLSIDWDGRNRNGRYVGSGTYLAVVKVVDGEGVTTVRKMFIGVKK